MKLLENGLKAPNIMPDNCQTKEQLCCLIFTELFVTIMVEVLSQTRTVHLTGLDSDTAGHKEFDLFIWTLQGNFCAKVKEILWTFTWTDDTETAFSCGCRHESMHNPSTRTQITAEFGVG